MEQLLFSARRLVQSMNTGADDPEGHHPNLPIPEEWAHIPTLEQYLEIQEVPFKGQGFVAKQNLRAGTLLMVEKPIAMVLDSEEDDDEGGAAAGPNGRPSLQMPGAATATAAPSATRPVVSSATPSNGFYVEEVDEEDIMEDDDDGYEDVEDLEEDGEDGVLAEAIETENDDDDKDPRLNELLLLEVLDQLNSNPHLWQDQLSKLFPRTDQDLAQLPAWVCNDDDIFVELENGVKEFERQHASLAHFAKDISKRLPLILRYNILSTETCPELLSYAGPEGYSKLSGVGLYYLPSFFNHNKQPNCSRFAIGDVMCFVTNQDITAGTEVCISYIEHDVLCESAYRRNLMLSMNFKEIDDDGVLDTAMAEKEADGPEMPVVDSDVQNELMGMDPLERLTSIDELLAQATGQKGPQDQEEMRDTPQQAQQPPQASGDDDDDDAMETTAIAASSGPTTTAATTWFQCDVQNLRILKAITLEGLGQSRQALALWEEAIYFCDSKLPPNDETGVPVRIQAALTAWHLGDIVRARHHAAAALQRHNLVFGGGVALFRIRMGPDLRLRIRPSLPPPVSATFSSPIPHRNNQPTPPPTPSQHANNTADPITSLWPYA